MVPAVVVEDYFYCMVNAVLYRARLLPGTAEIQILKSR